MRGTKSAEYRSRWAAVGAAVAVSFGAGGIYIGNAANDSAASSFVAITPVRVLDTRTNLGLSGMFTAPIPRDLLVTGSIATTDGVQVVVPTGATAVSLNVTVVGPSAAGFLTVRPADATGAISTSSLNFVAGQVIPNAVTVKVPTAGGDVGKIEISYDAFGVAGPTTHVLVDIVGYFQVAATVPASVPTTVPSTVPASSPTTVPTTVPSTTPADGAACAVGGQAGTIVNGYDHKHDASTKCFLSRVTTFAGIGGDGTADGILAQFSNPKAVAVDLDGNVYVADTANNRIRKITPAGAVTILAGTSGGFLDATGTAAQFNNPNGVAVDTAGNVYVADTTNNRIRKITAAGVVTTLAGQASAGTTDATGNAAQFNDPRAVAVDTAGKVYVADTTNNRIRKITAAGVVTTVAGSTAGFLDATGNAAQFNNPNGIAVDVNGNLYVGDNGNDRIRQIN